MIDTGPAPTLPNVAKRKTHPAIPMSPIARWRDRRGLTQKEVATALHTSQQNIDRLEKKPIGRVTVDWLMKFAKALNVPAQALIDFDGFDETDVALLQVSRRLPAAEKVRLLSVATAFETSIKIA